MLLYFDKIIGPSILISKPQDFIKKLSKQDLIQVKSLLDAGNDGFFTHDFSPEFRTANWIFHIPSIWARGGVELVMLTVIIRKEVETKEYQVEMERFIDRVVDIENIYRAFYINGRITEHQEDIINKHKLLDNHLDNLYKILSLKSIETEGELLSLKKIQEALAITIPAGMILNLENSIKDKKNVFIVYRVRGDALKIDLIPIFSKEVIKLELIFGSQMTPAKIREITETFLNYDTTLVFTSGICQEEDKCIYEVYIELKDLNQLEGIKSDFHRIKGVMEIRIEKFSIKSN